MNRVSGWRPERLWSAGVLIASLPLLVSLCRAMWKTPFPISETVSLLEDVAVSPHSFFDPNVRSWYRPLYHLTWYVFWRGSGSLDVALLLFRMLEVGSVVALVVLFIWSLRPRALLDAAAATVAVAVLLGSPGFRDNLELPLLMTLVAMPMAVVVWMLTERDWRAWHGPVVVALTLVAIGYKEQGLVLVPLALVAWWAGAPGTGRLAAAGLLAVTGVYLAIRLSTRGAWQPFEQDVALGFGRLSAREASERFGAFPWPLYAYNAASTLSNILFSEPSSGRFRMVFDLTHNRLAAWEVNHFLSSTALTSLIAWWGVRTWRRDAKGAWTSELRVVIAVVVTLGASAALGFNYARDRLGGMAVVFLAMGAYYAVRAAGARASQSRGPWMVAACAALVLVAAGWQLRAVGTLEEVRRMSQKNQREWITAIHTRRRAFAERTTYVQILNAMAPQGLDPALAQPTAYPQWIVRLLREP